MNDTDKKKAKLTPEQVEESRERAGKRESVQRPTRAPATRVQQSARATGSGLSQPVPAAASIARSRRAMLVPEARAMLRQSSLLWGWLPRS